MASNLSGTFIESLSWLEVEKLISTVRVAVIPIGARCKEHGPHLPLNTDWITAEYLAHRVAERCEGLFLPTIEHGFYPAFVEYPGSISLSKQTFESTIEEICRSFLRHGIRQFYFLNTGYSTVVPLEAVRERLRPDGVLVRLSDFRKLAVDVRKAIEKQPCGTHADEIETSMMLHIAPQLVRMEKAVAELSQERPGGLTREGSGPGIFSATGTWGDPTLATAEKGAKIIEAIVDELVADISALISE